MELRRSYLLDLNCSADWFIASNETSSDCQSLDLKSSYFMELCILSLSSASSP